MAIVAAAECRINRASVGVDFFLELLERCAGGAVINFREMLMGDGEEKVRGIHGNDGVHGAAGNVVVYGAQYCSDGGCDCRMRQWCRAPKVCEGMIT